MKSGQPLAARPIRHLFIFALGLLMTVQLALSLYAWSMSEKRLLPELGRKAQTVGVSLSHKLERALEYGIPLQRLEGVPDFFADVLRQNADLAYLRISAADGAILYGGAQIDAYGPEQFLDTPVPLTLNGVTVGRLHVGVDKRYVAARIRELRYDIGIVLLTSMLIAFEILWFVVTLKFRSVGGEPAQRRVVLVRVMSFLFMFAEMLSRPFLPVYADSLPAPGLGSGLHASLPVTAFLLGVALTMPFAGRWSDRMGRRSSYIAGAAIVMSGLAVTGLVPDYVALVLARAITGIGYAVMFMSCQGYVFDHTDSSNRGKGMALFVGAIMVAEICAPAVGGILADRIGYRMVFILGAAIALMAALVAAAVLDRPAGGAAPQAPAAPAPLLRLARNQRFLALSLLSGMPAKFLYTGFLIFLVPTLLSSLGHTKSEIGRYTMLYGLSSLALAPLFAHLADRYRAYAALVTAGGVLTGVGLLPVLLGASGDMVILGIGALGVGQSMSISAQLVLVARVTQAEARDAGASPIVGLFRMLERLGAAAGPVAAGLLAARYGAQNAMAALGAFALAASLLFALVFMLTRASAAGAADELAA